MIRPVNSSMTVLMASALLLAACDRGPPAPKISSSPEVEAFDNGAATQSIMQPKVIAESPPPPTPTPTPATPPLPSATVLFAHGTTLDGPARAVLDRLTADPAVPPDASFVLRGNSDSPGSDAANLAKSRKRAIAVGAYLKAKGIAAERLKIIALGERRAVAPNARLDGSDDPDGRARNRRVDIEVVAASATPLAPASSPAVSAPPVHRSGGTSPRDQ